MRNDGTLPFLPDECGHRGDLPGGHRPAPRRCRSRRSAPNQPGLVAHVSAYEELALDAALRGGRDRVYRALLAHPLVGQHDLAEALTDRLLAANTAHLAWAR